MVDLQKIRRLRDAAGMSQGDAAAKAGFEGEAKAQRWSDIENGRRKTMTVKTLEAIAKALGVKAKELLK